MEKLLEQALGKLLVVARALQYPFKSGSITVHVTEGKFAKVECSIWSK